MVLARAGAAAWRLLTDVRFAVLLIALLALSGLVGIFVRQFPVTQAIHSPLGDQTHECSCRPVPTYRTPEPGPDSGCTIKESLRTIAMESPDGDHDADRTIPSPGVPRATRRGVPPIAGAT